MCGINSSRPHEAPYAVRVPSVKQPLHILLNDSRDMDPAATFAHLPTHVTQFHTIRAAVVRGIAADLRRVRGLAPASQTSLERSSRYSLVASIAVGIPASLTNGKALRTFTTT